MADKRIIVHIADAEPGEEEALARVVTESAASIAPGNEFQVGERW